jgi:plastocyanin
VTSSRLDMKRIPLILLALAALAVAGCGSSKGSGSSSAQAPPATSTAPASGGGTVVIKMKNIAFNPKDVTVKVGQTVKWENEDNAPHNVTGGPLHSKTLGNGASFSYTPTKAGKISYVCTIHPGMTATLNVTS